MPSGSEENQPINEPLYNSRLIKNYVDYVRKFHPGVDMREVLHYAWIKTYELEDQGHWFSQWQVDRFHERLAQKTGDSTISRKVGRHAASSEAAGALKNYALGFMTPGAAYWVLEKIAPHLTRAVTLKSKRLGANRFEITATPRPGVSMKPYQCDNLGGQLEALSNLFTGKFPRIEHSECMHKGARLCRYRITLEKTPSFLWGKLRNYLILPSLAACLGLHFLVSNISWTAVTLLFLSIVLGISFYFERLKNQELIRNVEGQRDAVKLLLDQINIRYNDVQLIKEIGQATSSIMGIESLLANVIKAIENRLDFDRGGIWLANQRRDSLVYHLGFGYNSVVQQVLKSTEFHLDNPYSRGVAVQAFRQQRPYLVNDVGKIEKDLSKRSLGFMQKLGTQSFICVPIVYERESLGVLFVDNVKSKRPLSQSDMSLLTGIATQIAICIYNAISYQKLQESKEVEQNLRKLFEKYVPSPVIKRYLNYGEVDLFRGEEAYVTAMFLDIRDFTASAESMEAEGVVSFLNSYFEKCSQIISDKGGHINKYTGDGFFAIFGAPEPLNGHASLAFDAARQALEMSKKFILEGKPLQIGVGLHTGRVIMGNIGSQTKIEYTAIGNTVNMAARLQEFTKLFHEFPIVMSRAVREALAIHNEHSGIRNLGVHKIRGTRKRVDAFGYSPTPITSNQDRAQGLAGFLPLQRIKGV